MDAQEFLSSLSDEAAQQFTRALDSELRILRQETAERIARRQPPLPLDEVGSIAFSLPVYQRLLFTTKKRRRRSSSGKWRLYYTLGDADGDGRADIIQVLTIHHAAAQPLDAWLASEESDAV